MDINEQEEMSRKARKYDKMVAELEVMKMLNEGLASANEEGWIDEDSMRSHFKERFENVKDAFVVGDYNFFATSLLCGHNIVGDDNYFGIRGTTLPEISIGNRNVIQAGMIVDKNIENDTTIFYRYKEKLLAIPDKKSN